MNTFFFLLEAILIFNKLATINLPTPVNKKIQKKTLKSLKVLFAFPTIIFTVDRNRLLMDCHSLPLAVKIKYIQNISLISAYFMMSSMVWLMIRFIYSISCSAMPCKPMENEASLVLPSYLCTFTINAYQCVINML